MCCSQLRSTQNRAIQTEEPMLIMFINSTGTALSRAGIGYKPLHFPSAVLTLITLCCLQCSWSVNQIAIDRLKISHSKNCMLPWKPYWRKSSKEFTKWNKCIVCTHIAGRFCQWQRPPPQCMLHMFRKMYHPIYTLCDAHTLDIQEIRQWAFLIDGRSPARFLLQEEAEEGPQEHWHPASSLLVETSMKRFLSCHNR